MATVARCNHAAANLVSPSGPRPETPASASSHAQVTIEHAVNHATAHVTVPTAAFVHEVIASLANQLQRPDILKSVRLVRKGAGQSYWTSINSMDKIGKRRHFLCLGVEDFTVGKLSAVEVAKLPFEKMLNLVSQLNETFATPVVQRRLSEIEWAAADNTDLFAAERELLVLDVQMLVLPEFGFEASVLGVREMLKTAESFVPCEELFRNAVVADYLLHAGSAIKNRKPSARFGEASQYSETTVAHASYAAAEMLKSAAASGPMPRLSKLAQKWKDPLSHLVDVQTPPVGSKEVWAYRTSPGGFQDRLSALNVSPLVSIVPSATHDTEPRVVLDPNVKYQEIIGFGGSFTQSSADLVNQMDAENQNRIVKAYFDAEEGLGYRLGRMHINSCDFSKGDWSCIKDADLQLASFSLRHYQPSILPLVRRAIETVAKSDSELLLVASPWSPPAWMKDTGQMTRGGKLKKEFQSVWAKYYIRFAAEMQKAGAPLWALTVQNEPAAKTKWENCLYTAENERDFVRHHLGPALEDSNLDLKLFVWDHNRDGMFSRARTMYADSACARYVWGVAFHWYGDPLHEKWPDASGQKCFDNVARVHDLRPDKHLIMTEACQEGGPHVSAWGVAERYADNIIRDLNNWTEAWIDWNLVLDSNGGPNHAGNYCSAPVLVNPQRDIVLFQPSFYYIAHFSRFVRHGARRILCSTSRDVLQTIAFENPDGSLILVVLNQKESSINFKIEVAGTECAAVAAKHSITTFLLGAVAFEQDIAAGTESAK